MPRWRGQLIYMPNSACIGSQRDDWQCSKCNSGKNRHRAGDLWYGGDSREGHAGQAANIGAEITRLVCWLLVQVNAVCVFAVFRFKKKGSSWSTKEMSFQFLLVNLMDWHFVSDFRESKEKVKSGRFGWGGWWRRWSGPIDTAGRVRSGPGKLCSTNGPNGDSSRGCRTWDAPWRISG